VTKPSDVVRGHDDVMVDARAWLARSCGSKSPSMARVHSAVILTEWDALLARIEELERRLASADRDRTAAEFTLRAVRAALDGREQT